MNASAPALPREDEVQSKIRKVRAFGRNARVACAAIFGFTLVGYVVSLLFVFLMPMHAFKSNSDHGAFSMLMSPLTPLQLKVWWFLLTGVGTVVWLAFVHQLYRLFGNLAAGAIYTRENVRCVRNIGLLCLLRAVLSIWLPATFVVARRLTDVPVPIDLDRVFPPFGELVSSFIVAGLVLFASWIMDVGLYEKEHADALQRDADFVI